MSGERSMICIVCPVGCRLIVSPSGKGGYDISGNKCARGIDYALSELSGPKRTVSGVVRIERAADRARDDGEPAMCPCKSSSPVPKELIPLVLEDMRRARAKPPIRLGDVLLGNPRDCGADIIATRNIDS